MFSKRYAVPHLKSELVLILGYVHHTCVCNAAGKGHPRLCSSGATTQLLPGLDNNFVCNGCGNTRQRNYSKIVHLKKFS